MSWTNPSKKFVSYFGKATVDNKDYIANYVARDPS
jgi:hypothetical protein